MGLPCQFFIKINHFLTSYRSTNIPNHRKFPSAAFNIISAPTTLSHNILSSWRPRFWCSGLFSDIQTQPRTIDIPASLKMVGEPRDHFPPIVETPTLDIMEDQNRKTCWCTRSIDLNVLFSFGRPLWKSHREQFSRDLPIRLATAKLYGGVNTTDRHKERYHSTKQSRHLIGEGPSPSPGRRWAIDGWMLRT